MRVRHFAPGLIVLVALVAAGCGSTDDETPEACQNGKGAYLEALADAPGEVRLAGQAPISDCLAENQPGGELATAGSGMVEAATDLNAEAREDPGGPAAVQLGYLLGAAERGAEETAGIHADLIRRIEAAALYSPGGRPLPPALLFGYERGLDAGRAAG
jgi:hypothetical protein